MKSHLARYSFEKADSYLNPNARCPVCGASVFFYQSPHNGRVFFDDVGWPWPKHPCTDKFKGRDGAIRTALNSRLRFHFRNRDGKPLQVFSVEEILESDQHLVIRLKELKIAKHVVVLVSRLKMREKGISKKDFDDAPTMVLPQGSMGETEISFISARLQAVVVIAATIRSG